MNNNKEDRKFPLYLIYKKDVYAIMGYIGTDMAYQNRRGYIDSQDRVWIFSNERPSSGSVPSFWYEHGELQFTTIRADLASEFVADKLKDYSTVSLVSSVKPGEKLYDEDMSLSINSSRQIYRPVINESDDFLKKAIKQAIIAKEVDMRQYGKKVTSKYQLANLKTALENKTKMSTQSFLTWCEILGLRFDLTIVDDGSDPYSKMKRIYTISNEDNEIVDITNGEPTKVVLTVNDNDDPISPLDEGVVVEYGDDDIDITDVTDED